MSHPPITLSCMFFSLEAMKKSRSRQLLVVFIGTVHVFLWFSARMRVFYCIQTCCQLWKISYYMLIFQPHPPHIITNSWRPLHDLSHSTIMLQPEAESFGGVVFMSFL